MTTLAIDPCATYLAYSVLGSVLSVLGWITSRLLFLESNSTVRNLSSVREAWPPREPTRRRSAVQEKVTMVGFDALLLA